MSEFRPVDSGPGMQSVQVDGMMIHVLRLPELFTLALGSLEVDLFNPSSESHLAALWSCARKVHAEYGMAGLFGPPGRARQLLESELSGYLASNPRSVGEDYQTVLLDPDVGFLRCVYDKVRPDELFPGFGRRSLLRFLEERFVQEPVRRAFLQAGSGSVLNLPLFLQQMRDRQAQVAAMDENPVDELCPEDWVPSPLGKFPTNVKFLDRFLNGGHAPGETYGVLGALGAGKTTLAVQLVVAGALYQRQLAIESVDDIAKGKRSLPYVPKKWYFFHYEGSGNEMRVRLLSCLCQIDKDKLEDARFEAFSTSGNLHDYEKLTFADWIQDNQTVPGEKERWAAWRTMINHCFGMVDMSGSPANPRRGQGYVPEVAEIIDRDVRCSSAAAGHQVEVGGVVIDYAGLCVRRHVSSLTRPDPDSYYRLLSDFGEDCRRQIAVPFGCPVWIMHQLSGQANKRTHASRASYADAAGSASFAENLYFCFALGTKDPEFGSMLLTCSKARRSDLGTSPRLEFDVPVARLRASNLVDRGNGQLSRPGAVKATM